MKHSIAIFSLAAVSALVALSGCDTFASRARERSATYEALPPHEQQRLRRGEISVGDTQDMVYIAFGTPDVRRTIVAAGGIPEELWIYRTYWQQYEGSAWVGYRRVVVPARNHRGYYIYHEPVTRDVYSTHADDVIRVTLANGVVQSVEQLNGYRWR